MSYATNPWSAGYSELHYFRGNVQKHLLFPTYAFAAYRLARTFGYQGSGLKPLQVTNGIMAAIAIALFALLLSRPSLRSGDTAAFGGSPKSEVLSPKLGISDLEIRISGESRRHVPASGSNWLAIFAGLGLAFSAAFSSMATSIAEVVPAMPWLMLALLLLQKTQKMQETQETQETSELGERSDTATSAVPASEAVLLPHALRPVPHALLVGILLGISACFYFVTAAIGLAVVVWLLARRQRCAGFILAAGTLLTALVTYVGILLLAGWRGSALGWALFFLPEQGTYGGLKLSDFATVLLGFASSIFPVLPESFSGLRSLLSQLTSGYRFYYGTVILPLVLALGLAFFIALVRFRNRFASRSRSTISLGLTVFAGALVVSLFWDPYHPKIWMYSNIGLWLMIAGLMAHLGRSGDTIPNQRTDSGHVPARLAAQIVFALALFCIVSMNLARRITRAGPNPRWTAAQAVAGIVNEQPKNLILGGWEDEFDYLALLVPESNLVSLPDWFFEQNRDSLRFNNALSELLAERRQEKGRVYALNLFNRDQAEVDAFYRRRLRAPVILSWLERQGPAAQAVWQDSLTGIALYELR